MAISSGSVHIQDPIVLMAHSDRLQRFSQRRDWLFPSNVRSEVISIRWNVRCMNIFWWNCKNRLATICYNLPRNRTFGCKVKIAEYKNKLQLPIFMTMRDIMMVEIYGVNFAIIDVLVHLCVRSWLIWKRTKNCISMISILMRMMKSYKKLGTEMCQVF